MSLSARAPAGSAKLYEQEALRRVTGPALRPGGLDLTRRALEALALPAGARVLDVGCGLGATLGFLRGQAGALAFGVDISLTMLAAARELTPPVWAAARADALPFGHAAFAAVFCECVLSLLEAPALALAEMGRVLNPGGRLVISDLYRADGPPPALAEPRLEEPPLASCLQGAMDRAALEALLAQAGFVLELFEDHARLLKELAARLILAGGSLAAFWDGVLGPGAAGQGARALAACRPRYCLIIARKGE